ncbi:glutamate 5-kinase [Trametes versicolor FP-101664 SS1]|uniref:glutamate 5-kinase n=1 Tax=Trametes versicolor (strain FP-101664) TaxID=717944 RepID=UPI000462480A|nr:glutamate 5-kinase [Trametes versicolor FP-101664 SS1]EIW60925.1 glutamate 5-kinase [Trametes versicolor FP-101664 SS1]
MARPRHLPSQTIVIKLGTSSIVHETTHQPLLSTLSAIVETVVHLRAQGHKVVLVSSGAIGVGLKRMEVATRPKALSKKQALAAIGQGRLIALWDNLFGQLGQPIAQILLTRGDISDRTRYLNAVNTFKELLSMGVVPIVNENDTVSVSEIKFGDNDTLSAITSSMIHADYLFLLTDVDGLYTSNPRKDPNASRIDVVTSIATIRSQVSTSTLGSSLGTGGMETKLIAAEIATAAGVMTVVTSSKDPQSIFKIIEYNSAFKSGTNTPLSGLHSGRTSPEPHPVAPSITPTPSTPGEPSVTPTPSSILPSSSTRPPHTIFLPSALPLRDLKAWTSHTLHPSGSVIIDSGAHHVLSKRESGGRLLAAGVLGVRGAFASGQAVRILIRTGPPGEATETVAGSEKVEGGSSYADGTVMTEPNTPEINATASLSSSISTLDQLSIVDEEMTPSTTLRPLPEDDTVLIERPVDSTAEWELEEVGRGLANYNSAQIERVKGLRSSYIPQLLGYADSEYVVENITIRVPPS